MKKTDEQLLEIAAGYDSRSDFNRADPANYMACYRRKLLDKAFGDPQSLRYADDVLIDSALKYNTRGEWAKGARAHYNAAKRRPDGFFEAVTGHMESAREEWDDETIRGVALSLPNQEAFRRLARGAWSAAVRRGMIPALKKEWEARADG